MKNATLVDDSPDIVRDFVIRRRPGNIVVYRPKLDIDNKSMGITSAQAAKETTEALDGGVIRGNVLDAELCEQVL